LFSFCDKRKHHHNRVSVDIMLLVCGTQYQFCFVDNGNMPFFKDIWEQGKMVTKSPPSCITTILSPTSPPSCKMVVILDQGQMC
jgi:hypothetical protein